MLARLQQCLTLGTWLFAIGAAWLGGTWGLWLAGATLTWPFCLVGIECAALRFVNRHDPAPAPSARQVLSAFVQECAIGFKVFNWRQPFRSRRIPDAPNPPGARGQRGVVLVHGYVCNRGIWWPWLKRLQAAGTPFIAVNLEPVFGDIDDYTPHIESAVSRLEASTGCPPLIVAHSMGGLAVRAWLRQQRAAKASPARIAHILTIGTPHQGTWVAYHGYTRNVRQMRPGSAWLRTLAAHEPADLGRQFTCIYGHCDNVVMPSSHACLAGAQTIHIEGTPHMALIYHPLTWQAVQAHLVTMASAETPGRAGGGAPSAGT